MGCIYFGHCGCDETPITEDPYEEEDQAWFGQPPNHPNWWEWYQRFPDGLNGDIPLPELINMTFTGASDGDGNIAPAQLKPHPSTGRITHPVSFSHLIHGETQRVQAIVRVPVLDRSEWSHAKQLARINTILLCVHFVSYRDPFQIGESAYQFRRSIIQPASLPSTEAVLRQDKTFVDGYGGDRHFHVTWGNPKIEEGGVFVYNDIFFGRTEIPVDDVIPPGSSVRIRMTMIDSA